MIPQPKTIVTHEKLQELFSARYPTGTLDLSKNVGGAKRKYSICFSEGTKRYNYSGTARDVAIRLELLPEYAITRKGVAGFVVTHWNNDELQQIADYCNGNEFQKAEEKSCLDWGVTYTRYIYEVTKIS